MKKDDAQDALALLLAKLRDEYGRMAEILNHREEGVSLGLVVALSECSMTLAHSMAPDLNDEEYAGTAEKVLKALALRFKADPRDEI